MPVLIGALSHEILKSDRWSITEEHISAMNTIFREIAEELPACKVVSAEGLLVPDTALSCNELPLLLQEMPFGYRHFPNKNKAYLHVHKAEECLFCICFI